MNKSSERSVEVLTDQIVQEAYLTPKQALPPANLFHSISCEDLLSVKVFQNNGLSDSHIFFLRFHSPTYLPALRQECSASIVISAYIMTNLADTTVQISETTSETPLQDISSQNLPNSKCILSKSTSTTENANEINNTQVRKLYNTFTERDDTKKINIKKDSRRLRKKGGGAKKVEEKNPKIMEDLENFVSDGSYGNPQNPLRYKSKSLRKLTRELNRLGYDVSYGTVARLLKRLNFSLQENRKLIQVGKDHPDRDEQFKFINQIKDISNNQQQIVISIDSKKKEKLGNFFQDGREYAKKGRGKATNDHDFGSKDQLVATLYGIYVISTKEGFVNIGLSSDTPEYAINSIRYWLNNACKSLSNMNIICIEADGGGSNSSRSHMFKIGLQHLADEFDIAFFDNPLPTWNIKMESH